MGFAPIAHGIRACGACCTSTVVFTPVADATGGSGVICTFSGPNPLLSVTFDASLERDSRREFVLEHLAERVAGQGVDEVEAAGALERRQPFRGESL